MNKLEIQAKINIFDRVIFRFFKIDRAEISEEI